jgi:RNA-directed DNA polymerase
MAATWLVPRGLTFNEDKTCIVHLDDGFDFRALRRVPCPARHECGGSPREDQPRSCGDGRTTEGRRRPLCSQPRTCTCGGSPPNGPATPTPTSRSAGSSTGTSAGTTRPGRTAGCSATATAAPTPQDRLDQDRPARAGTRGRVSGRPRPGRLLGRPAPQEQTPARPQDLHLLRRQNGSCPICGQLLLRADREPQSPREWQQWHRTTRKAITRQHIIAHGTGLPDDTRLVHSSCHRRTTGGQKDPAPLYS